MIPQSLEILRETSYRLFFCAQAASLFGDGFVVVALVFAVLEIGGSPSDVGLVLACETVPLAAVVLIGGAVADRVSRRAVMVGADLARVASQGLIAAILIAGVAEVWMLAVMAAVTGAATAFFNPASTALLPVIVAPERLQQANGLQAIAMSAGRILGPAASGVLIGLIGAGWAIGVDAATFAFSAILLARLPLPAVPAGKTTPFLSHLRAGWDEFRSRRWIWTFVAGFGVVNLMWGAWHVLGPVVAERDLGGAATWGAILAAAGTGALFGALVATRVTPRHPLVIAALAGIVIALPLGALAMEAPALLLALSAAVSSAAMMFQFTIWQSTLQRNVPNDKLSRVSSYDWLGSLAFYPLGVAMWGPVATVIGMTASLWVAFLGLVVAMIVLLAVPDVRRLGST